MASAKQAIATQAAQERLLNTQAANVAADTKVKDLTANLLPAQIAKTIADELMLRAQLPGAQLSGQSAQAAIDSQRTLQAMQKALSLLYGQSTKKWNKKRGLLNRTRILKRRLQRRLVYQLLLLKQELSMVRLRLSRRLKNCMDFLRSSCLI